MSSRTRFVVALLALSLSAAGCTSDSGGSSSQPESTPPTSASATGSATPSPTTPTATSTASGRYSRDGITVTGAPGAQPTIVLAEDVGPADELVVADIVEGTGDPVTAASELTVHYTGVGQKSRQVFDSSWDGQPATFDLSGVIEGWQQGMLGMKQGGRRLLVIPGALAYGPAGVGPIGPDETLVFVVDLLEVSQP